METVQASGRVLLVDDEPTVCELLNDALLRAGYNCQSCSTGEEALRALKREPFDIVIADLYMPGISGMSLLKEGTRVRPESAFLMATGEADARVGVEAMKHGAADYLVKPFPIASLV
jgi:DNA-binding NtrC family response regulator